jgi:selenocysteine lyase/cysteine desulfurase
VSHTSRLAQQRLVLRTQANDERDALAKQGFAARERWRAQCSTVAGTVQAIGLTDARAKSSIRLGFGRYTSAEEIDIAAEAINRAAEAML